MPYNIILDNLPAGIALTSVRGGGEVRVAFKEFTSSEDGDLFIQQLVGIPNDILKMISADQKASTIDHMLVVVKRDKSATIYLNELKFIAQIRPKREIKEKGEPIFQDDIAEIQRMDFGDGVVIPDDAGFLFLFSSGWRKGLFFDFGMLHDPAIPRGYDTGKILGHYLSYLEYQHLFKLSEVEWKELFDQKWFPFTSLKTSTVERMLNYIRNEIPVDDLLESITSEVQSSTGTMLERWKSNPFLNSHMELINRAVERYMQNDYISANSILYPRIEGIMRDVFRKENVSERASAKTLTKTLTSKKESIDTGTNLLLPNLFHKYLDDVYFLGFEPGQVAEISRNSVAHGVARPQDFSVKPATIGLLMLDQLFFFLPSEKP